MPPAKDKQLTLGVPLNGILTFRGRTLPGEWQCAVCTTRNPKDEPRCSCCRQLRVVDWLRNTKGMLLQPGVVLVGHEPADPTIYSRARARQGVKRGWSAVIITCEEHCGLNMQEISCLGFGGQRCDRPRG